MKETILNKTNGRCFYCNSMQNLQVDHFISRKKWKEWDLENTHHRGLLSSIENLFPACRKCNLSKSAKCPEDFFGNSYKIWDRYYRANHRVNLLLNIDVNF